MTDKINPESMQVAFDKNYQTFLAKNADYGNSFEKSLDDLGIVAGVVRIGDKYNRVCNLLSKTNKTSQRASQTR